MQRRLATCTTLAILTLTTACTTLPRITPAPPPGSTAHWVNATTWEGSDGSVETTPNRRAPAYVAIRRYCNGPFEVVREDSRLTVTPMSFPFPVKKVEIFFRCGEGDESMEDAA